MYVHERSTPRAATSVAELNKHLVFNAVRQAETARVDEVVRATGRSQPTVLKWLARLEQEGWVQRPGVGASTGGRPPALYRFVSEAGYLLGVAMEIPGARVTLVDMGGRVVASEAFEVDPEVGPQSLLSEVTRRVHAFATRCVPPNGHLLHAGVVLSGFIDRASGVSLATPRIPGWHEVPISDVLGRHLGTPVTLHHHVDALTLAEICFGSIENSGDVLYFDVGYGLGVRLVKDGTSVRGSFGNAGLIGHTTVVPNGRSCLCGNRGCLEEYVSGRALLREASEYGRRAHATAEHTEQDDVQRTAADLFRGAEAGEDTARRHVDEIVRYLAVGVANAVNTFDVPRVVLSGFVRAGGDPLRRRLQAAVRARLQPVLARHLDIGFAVAPRSRAGAHGAALFALRERLPFADPLVTSPRVRGKEVSVRP